MSVSISCKYETKGHVDKLVQEKKISRRKAHEVIALLSDEFIETVKKRDYRARAELGQVVPKIQNEKKITNAKFNPSNESIGWAAWTWNSVTGCKHGCKYCYARDIANRFPENYPRGFEPHFRENRLSAPKNSKIPIRRENEPGIRNVFTCSMSDLFAVSTKPEWINSILDVVNQNPQWNYCFLTKNPKKYLRLNWPPHCWVGATADTQARANEALEVFSQIQNKNQKPEKLFLSCEPLEEKITIGDRIKYIDWLIIGARSKSTGMPAAQPRQAWVLNLANDAEARGIPIFLKDNLKVFKRLP